MLELTFVSAIKASRRFCVSQIIISERCQRSHFDQAQLPMQMSPRKQSRVFFMLTKLQSYFSLLYEQCHTYQLVYARYTSQY